MLVKLLEALLNLEASKRTPQKVPQESFMLLDGKVHPTPAPRVVSEVTRLSSLIDDYAGGLVFVSDLRVVNVDANDSRDVIELPLDFDPIWTTLYQMAREPKQTSHRDVIRLLRDALLLDEVSIAPFRAVTFGSSGTATSVAGRRDDRIGRDIREELSESTPIPDTIRVQTAIYTNPGETARYAVNVAVIVEPLTQTFVFRPDEREMRETLRIHSESIVSRLRERLGEDVTILYGTPRFCP